MRGKATHHCPVTDEVRSGQILGENVCYHVRCTTVNAADNSVFDALAECVYPVVNVFGSVVGDRVFTHHLTALVVLVQRGGVKLFVPTYLEYSAQEDDVGRRSAC